MKSLCHGLAVGRAASSRSRRLCSCGGMRSMTPGAAPNECMHCAPSAVRSSLCGMQQNRQRSARSHWNLAFSSARPAREMEGFFRGWLADGMRSGDYRKAKCRVFFFLRSFPSVLPLESSRARVSLLRATALHTDRTIAPALSSRRVQDLRRQKGSVGYRGPQGSRAHWKGLAWSRWVGLLCPLRHRAREQWRPDPSSISLPAALPTP